MSRSSTMFVLSLPVITSLAVAGYQGDRPGAGSDTKAGTPGPKEGSKQSCSTAGCHDSYKKLEFTHGPVVLDRCLFCHEADEDSTPYESGDEHSFELIARDGRLCIKCHESQASDVHVHYPVRRSRCVACHDPHGSDNPAMMRHASMADNCYECHENMESDEPSVHGPVALGECTTCHDPHASPYPAQIHAIGPELCLGCHEEKKKVIAAQPHAHRPVMEGCNQCHDPHDGKDANRLRKDVPELCLGCHEDIGKKASKARRKHGALDAERSCLHCHDPHSANFSKQLRDVPKDLCLSCHDKAIVGEDGMLRDMKSYLAENNYHHGPIREGDCGSCHDPHGSDFSRILRMKYPGEFYAPFDLARYELCFSCHEKSLVLDRETDTLTGFRNGTTNLHFVHVNRPRKGRTCRACHDVHASTSPKHIVEAVPFGSTWSYSLHYQKTADGGSCGPACHKPRSYGRTQPVINK